MYAGYACNKVGRNYGYNKSGSTERYARFYSDISTIVKIIYT